MNIIMEEELVIPSTLSMVRFISYAIFFPLTFLALLYAYCRSKRKMQGTALALLCAYMLEFAIRFTQAFLNHTGSPNEAISIYDACREVIYVICWILLFSFLSELLVVMTLLTEQEDLEGDE